MKKLIIGLVIGLLIGSMGSVLAATDTVQAVFAKFNIKINDNEPIEIQPLTFNGRTYLPVREVGELLGYEVDYDSVTKTIMFITKEDKDLLLNSELISVNELRNLLDYMTLGQYKDYKNVLTLAKGSVEVHILDVVMPLDNDKKTFSILNGGLIDIVFKDGMVYLPKKSLIELGLLSSYPSDEWISIRDLSQIPDLTISSGYTITYGKSSITIDAKKISSEPTVFETEYGKLTVMSYNGFTYINREDWESVFEKMKN